MNETFLDIPVFDKSSPFYVSLTGTTFPDKNYRIYRQKSEVSCLEYIISGAGTVKINGKTYFPKQGDTYFLISGQDHEYYSDAAEPWEKIWFNAHGPLIRALAEIYGISNTVLFHCNSLPYIQKMQEILTDKFSTPEQVAAKTSICFHELLIFLSKSKEPLGNISHEAELLKNFIDTNIHCNISVNDLAGLIFRSPAQTIRIFKKYYGITPYEYHMRNKIDRAIILLSNTNYSVKEIAYQLGFCDEHYFSNIFRKKTKKKPTDYK